MGTRSRDARVNSACPMGARRKREMTRATEKVPVGLTAAQAPLIERTRRELRVRHYSLRTERSYLQWAERFFGLSQRRVGARQRRRSEDVSEFCEIAFIAPRFRVEQLEPFGWAFDAARWGWDCPTMIVTVCLKRRPSLPLVAQCVLFI